METDASKTPAERTQAAIDRREEQVECYRKHKGIDRTCFYVTQSVAVALGPD